MTWGGLTHDTATDGVEDNFRGAVQILLLHDASAIEPAASRSQTFAACAFSQSLRNFSRPMSVSGCLKHCSMTAAGTVTTSAPMRAASTTWIGLRTLATSTSVA